MATERNKSRVPNDFSVKAQLYDKFTLGDLGRIGLPAAAGFALAGPPGLALGAAFGSGVAFLPPGHPPADVQLWRAANYVFGISATSWPIVEEVRDGYIRLDNGALVGVVKVNSSDVYMRSASKQEALQRAFNAALSTLQFPIEIHSKQRRVDLDEYTTPAEDTIVTDHYVVTGVYPSLTSFLSNFVGFDSLELNHDQDPEELLDERIRKLRNGLTRGDMYADRVTGESLKTFAGRYEVTDAAFSWRSYQPLAAEDMLHRRGLYVTGFDDYPPVGWLADVLNVDGIVNTVQLARPIRLSKLNRSIKKIQGEMGVARDPTRVLELEDKLADAEWTMRHDPIQTGVYISTCADDEPSAKSVLRDVKDELRGNRITFREPVLKTHAAAKTESVFHANAPCPTLTMPSLSAACSFPFSTVDTIESGGIWIGEDTRNNRPVIIDRFGWDAGHIAILGQTGSGKTVLVRAMLNRSFLQYEDLVAYILDAKGDDYAEVSRAHGGIDVLLGEEPLDQYDRSADIVRFTVPDPSTDNTELLVKAAQHIYRRSLGDPRKTLVVLEEARKLLRDDDGQQAVSELVHDGRFKNVAVTMVTQNLDHFLQADEGKDILQNTHGYILMNHSDIDDSLGKFFKLASIEDETVHNLQTGNEVGYSEAIIRSPAVNTKLRFEVTEDERKLVFKEDEA